MKDAIKERQVFEQVDEANNALDHLHGVVGDLVGRLASVLREEMPAEEACNAPDICLVPLADSIRRIVRNIHSNRMALTDMLERLEL